MSHYAAVDDPTSHPASHPRTIRTTSRVDLEASDDTELAEREVETVESVEPTVRSIAPASPSAHPGDTAPAPATDVAQWHSGDHAYGSQGLLEPLYSPDFPLPPLSLTPGPLVAAHPSAGGSWASQFSFYVFLIVFYIGSKGMSQLFASYVASREHLAAPIYLTACEYAMWMVLGAIHNFTLELETTSATPADARHAAPAGELASDSSEEELRQSVAVGVGDGEEKSREDTRPSFSIPSPRRTGGASTIPDYDPNSSPAESDIELSIVEPRPQRAGAALVQRRVLEPTSAAHSVPIGAPLPSSACACTCTCLKCSKPAERYPSMRITACYLCGELVKTILEVITVASVELSLALVLLATAPLFSVLFRFVLERQRPTAQECVIVMVVFVGLAMRIPEITSAPVGAIIGGLVSAASAAWISSFKSLIFDPPTAPHVLAFMYRFGPLLCCVTTVLMIATEMKTLKHAFRDTDESIETLSFGLMFAMLAAPSSVVSKRLQKLLGSFQRTLLGVANNVLVALVSIGVLNSTEPTTLAILGSLCVFLSPAIHFVDVNKWARRTWTAAQRATIAARRVCCN